MARILFFGKLSDIAGAAEREGALPHNIADTHALRSWLDAEFGGRGDFLAESVRLAINNEIVREPHVVSDGDEIAFMPPVGGG